MPAVGEPRPSLSALDAIAITVGVVVGAGIFRTPSLVAANLGSETAVLLAWLAGGGVSLIGALCYAELASAYPNAGGDYHYLHRAYGSHVSFLYAWARIVVIQTGSVALLAFVFGDYASAILPLGSASSAIYAALVVIGLTALNVSGVRETKHTQNLLTSVEVVGVVAISVVGFAIAGSAPAAPAPVASESVGDFSSVGVAMVLVLLTYGGWSEAAYISAEVRNPGRNMVRVLLWSIGILTGLYLLVNLAYLRGMGIAATAESEAVAADLLRRAGGRTGEVVISALIAVAALSSANTTILTGGRTGYALGQNFQPFRILGRWSERSNTPVNALLLQGAVALALVIMGALARSGFETMVSYTAPVFWLFFLLTAIGLIVLRAREPQVVRPFRVPAYPLTPLLLAATSAYLLYSSLAYTGVGALVGAAVLAVGVVLRLATRNA